MQLVQGETVYVQLPAINSPQKHFSLVVSPLRENRLHVTSHHPLDVTGHVTGDVIGQMVIARADSLAPICALNFPLPAAERVAMEKIGGPVDEEAIERVLRKRKSSEDEAGDGVSGETLRLTDVADMLHDDWQALATQLRISDADVDDILARYSYPSAQVRHTCSLQLPQ